MRRRLLTIAILAVVAVVGLGTYLGLGTVTDGGAEAASSAPKPKIHVKYSYSVKWLCGTPPGTVAADDYQTTINIRNPSAKPYDPLPLAKSVVHLVPGQRLTAPGDRVREEVPPFWSLQMDCGDIFALPWFGATSEEGFLVVESHEELEVWAVYTAMRTDVIQKDETTTETVTEETKLCLGPNGVVIETDENEFCPGITESSGTGVGVGAGIGVGTGVGHGVGRGIGVGVGTGLSMQVLQVEPTRVSYNILVP